MTTSIKVPYHMKENFITDLRKKGLPTPIKFIEREYLTVCVFNQLGVRFADVYDVSVKQF